MLPPPFVKQMQAQLGREYDAFEAALLQTDAPVSVRDNPLKIPAAPPPSGEPVPWHPLGRYLAERPSFTLDPRFQAGAYYVQEASSMFLHDVLRQHVAGSERPLRVLDFCAAPGGKSTLIAGFLAALPQTALLVSNEVIRARVNVLRENMEKWGYPNVAVGSADADDWSALPNWFDVVVTDAPCSGEGMFRKDPDAVTEWSIPHVEFCAGRQRRILAGAVQALAPGGLLVYSTCTYNKFENEANAAWLCSEMGLEALPLQFDPNWGIVRGEGEGLHFYPHRVRGEGFYIAAFRKKGEASPKNNAPAAFKVIKPVAKNQWPQLYTMVKPDIDLRFYQTPTGEVLALPAEWEDAYKSHDKVLKNKWFGTSIGEFKGKDFIPSHALAQSTLVEPNLPSLELSREQALLYLKKEVFDLPDSAPKGWVLVRYEGLNLGWIKALPNRMNNYLPAERRIRMEVK
jgi:16S rRNA C967 or C1407 C5-methylase (RsmB/RsmF family)/NOL1/NOP2/fmu family ribosome biogenesis protein